MMIYYHIKEVIVIIKKLDGKVLASLNIKDETVTELLCLLKKGEKVQQQIVKQKAATQKVVWNLINRIRTRDMQDKQYWKLFAQYAVCIIQGKMIKGKIRIILEALLNRLLGKKKERVYVMCITWRPNLMIKISIK